MQKLLRILQKKYGSKISLIPAGEQWADKTLRVAFEDLVGAGAIISYLTGSISPESKTALTIFESSKANLTKEINNCSSGKELIDRGFANDVLLACELNSSNNIPLLTNNAYVGQAGQVWQT